MELWSTKASVNICGGFRIVAPNKRDADGLETLENSDPPEGIAAMNKHNNSST